MTTPARILDPDAVIHDSVFAAAEAVQTHVNALRAEVEGSPLDRKNLDVRNAIMRSSGAMLKSVFRLLAIRQPALPADLDAGNGPPAATTTRDDPTAA